MKTTILRAILPLFAVAIASMSALAFSDARDAKGSDFALFTGWYRVSANPQVCEESATICSEINTNPVCTDGTHMLYKNANGGVTCPVQLYRK